MNSVFVFSEDGVLIGENLPSVNAALAYINDNIKGIMEINEISTVYVIIDFKNKISNFVKIGFGVVPA